MVSQRLNKSINEQIEKLGFCSASKEEDSELRVLINRINRVLADCKASPKGKDIIAMIEHVLSNYTDLDGRSSDGVTIAKKIKEYRREHDLSQVELAEELQCDRRQIVRWESGRHIPGRMTIRVLKQQKIL
jgi:DNA-binding transcriptional regulator YiaG